jgi:hypothetical protein
MGLDGFWIDCGALGGLLHGYVTLHGCHHLRLAVAVEMTAVAAEMIAAAAGMSVK